MRWLLLKFLLLCSSWRLLIDMTCILRIFRGIILFSFFFLSFLETSLTLYKNLTFLSVYKLIFTLMLRERKPTILRKRNSLRGDNETSPHCRCLRSCRRLSLRIQQWWRSCPRITIQLRQIEFLPSLYHTVHSITLKIRTLENIWWKISNFLIHLREGRAPFYRLHVRWLLQEFEFWHLRLFDRWAKIIQNKWFLILITWNNIDQLQ